MAKLIGPRLPSGRFTKTRKVRADKGLTKTQKQAVNKLIVAKSETKYCVSDITGSFIAELPKSFTSPVGWNYVMPRIAQSTTGANNQRIGETISNIRGKTTMYFYLSNLGLGLSQDVYVKIFYGHHKSVSDFNLFPNIQKNTLLEVGDQTTTDWNNDIQAFTPRQLASMPVSTNNWSLKTKIIRLTQNGGALNGAGGPDAPHASNTSHRTFVWKWNRKASIKYPSIGAVSNIPTNFCPVFIAVPWFANEQNVEDVSPVVSMQWRNEVYFHDV